MQSQFSQRPRRSRIVGSTPNVVETYDLQGLNQVAPDQVMPKGKSPYTINARRYARNPDENRVAIRSRYGSQKLSTPVSEAAGVQNTGSVIGDVPITADKWQAFQITASSTGVLSRFDLYVKKAAGTGGYLILEFYDNNSGFPGELIAETSIKPSDVAETYGYISSYLMDAPEHVNGAIYWVRARIQDLGAGAYYLGQTTGSNSILTTEDAAATYTSIPTSSARYKAYVAPEGLIKGFTRRYPQNAQNRTIFAFNNDIISVPDNPATPVVLDAGVVHTEATKVRFAQVDDKTIWVDGFNPARWWDGNTPPSAISNVPGIPTHVLVYQNRLLFVPKNDPTRVNFSALYDFTSYPSVNFFYVPEPKSPDHITAWQVFQDGVVIFTHETKHNVFGSDISTFTRKQAVGTKGAVSQEATAVDRNYIYFMADDKQIYRYNGVSDDLISGPVEPELQSILDTSKVSFHIYRNQLRVYYNKNPDDKVTHMLLFDIELDDWFMDTGRAVMGSLEWTNDDNELIEFSSRMGQMFFGERGNSDLGKAIDFKYWTSYQNFGSGAAKDRIKRFRPVVRPSDSAYNLLVGRDIDFNNTPDMRNYLVDSGGAKWGSFKWGDGTKWGGVKMIDKPAAMSGRGKHTQFRFEHKGVDQSVELYGYIALIKTGRAR